MTKQKWELKTHEEKPNWGEGDYDEYYEIVNERGDALQATDYKGLGQIADALNGFDGDIRITTALEINLHCDNQLLRAENETMRKALEGVYHVTEGNVMPSYQVFDDLHSLATDALKTNTHGEETKK